MPFFKKKIEEKIIKAMHFARKIPLLLHYKIYSHSVKNSLGKLL